MFKKFVICKSFKNIACNHIKKSKSIFICNPLNIIDYEIKLKNRTSFNYP